MKETERKNRPCAACGKKIGLATIVCGGEYPDAPLCMTCGTARDLDEVKKMIAQRLSPGRDGKE